MNEQIGLFDMAPVMDGGVIKCLRCGARCRMGPPPGEKTMMLRRARGTGLCVNCAVHDFLRNTYPPNILLAQSGPQLLLLPDIQKAFADVMKVGFSDAVPEEIDWQRIVDNWDMPFPHKMQKRNPMNPVSQKDLDEIASGERPGIGGFPPNREQEILRKTGGCITSFEQLNELKPGLGDDLKRCLDEGYGQKA